MAFFMNVVRGANADELTENFGKWAGEHDSKNITVVHCFHFAEVIPVKGSAFSIAGQGAQQPMQQIICLAIMWQEMPRGM